MDLYRVFDWDAHSTGAEPGGPLYIPRLAQGQGRHDIPERDGVLYTSLNVLSAVAEWIQFFRTRELTPQHFELSDGRLKALAVLELSEEMALPSLDDPQTLVRYGIKPSEIITHDRRITRLVAGRLFDDGRPGFLWPSSLEGSWINATLFQSRSQPHLKLKGPIRALGVETPEVVEAAAFFDMDIEE